MDVSVPFPERLDQTPRSLRRAWQVWPVSPRLYRVVAAVLVWSIAAVIVSGGAVRLTGSGLGCTDWPTCTATHVIAPLQFHAWMEFGNRLLNATLSIMIGVAVLGAHFRRPQRLDLILLGWGMFIGVLAEAVLGGITVDEKLAPQLVMAHFLLAVALLCDALVLHHRARQPDEAIDDRRARPAGPAVRLVSPRQLILVRILFAATIVVVVLGTIVTSTGPHAGAPDVPRFHFWTLHRAAQVHGSSVETFLALTLVTLWWLHHSRAPRQVIRNAEILLVSLVVQAAIGYTQYFLGDPALIVGFHLAGAVTVIWAVSRLNLTVYTRPLAVEAPPSSAASLVAG